MDLFSAFKNHLNQCSFFKSGDKIVLGVSGGIDSMVLLDLFSRLASSSGWALTVAHVNHRLRGRESERDAAFVKREADLRNLRFRLKTLPKRALSGSGNRQERARRLRYAFFARTARQNRATKIVTAHQADDQVETFLMRLIRGSGPMGLKGISPERDWEEFRLIRPLLPFTREALLQYAKERGLSWREDSSNQKEDYLRNLIRRRMIAPIKGVHPHALESIAKALEILREEDQWLAKWLKERAKGRFRRESRGLSLPLLWLKAQAKPLRYRLYRMGLQQALGSLRGITSRHLDMMEGMVIKENTAARLSLPGGYGARITQKRWIVQKWSRAEKPRTRGFFS